MNLGMGALELAFLPTYSISWFIQGDSYFDQGLSLPCETWMDEDTCSRRRDWDVDPMSMLTGAVERMGVGLAFKESNAYEIEYWGRATDRGGFREANSECRPAAQHIRSAGGKVQPGADAHLPAGRRHDPEKRPRLHHPGSGDSSAIRHRRKRGR